MVDRKQFITRWLDGFVLVVNSGTSGPPPKADWDDMLKVMSAHRRDIVGTLVHTEGSSPNAFQRQQVVEVYSKGTVPRTAVISDSAMIRVVLTAFNLFLDNRMKSFAPQNLDDAFHFLEVPPAQRSAARRCLSEMKNELGIRR